MAKGNKIHLLVIDPQIDFCDPKGALYVKGAENDMQRLAEFVRTRGHKLEDIHVTLDSHRRLHIAHPEFWIDSNGKHPPPITKITKSDVEAGKWRCSIPTYHAYTLEYLTKIETGQRYNLTIWPPHCLIGSQGHAVYPVLFEALNNWCIKNLADVHYVTKGSNIKTEHYSAVRAEVPDPKDPTTQLNMDFINVLMQADEIAVAGEAGDFCVANTVRDIANGFKDDSYVKKMVLLEGCYSPIFPAEQDKFIREMTARGMRVQKIGDYLV